MSTFTLFILVGIQPMHQSAGKLCGRWPPTAHFNAFFTMIHAQSPYSLRFEYTYYAIIYVFVDTIYVDSRTIDASKRKTKCGRWPPTAHFVTVFK